MAGHALDDSGPDAGLADADLDLTHEEIVDPSGAMRVQVALEVHGHAAASVEPGRDDDVDPYRTGHGRDPPHVAGHSDGGDIDHGAVASGPEPLERRDGALDRGLLIRPAIIGTHIAVEREDVLVHE